MLAIGVQFVQHVARKSAVRLLYALVKKAVLVSVARHNRGSINKHILL